MKQLFMILMSVVFLLVWNGVKAETLWVDIDGQGGYYATIQAAIDAAAPGDTIRVVPGGGIYTYDGFTVNKPRIHLIGSGCGFDENTYTKVTGNAVFHTYGDSSSMSYFYIAEISQYSGGYVTVNSGAENVTIAQNRIDHDIQVSAVRTIIQNNIFANITFGNRYSHYEVDGSIVINNWLNILTLYQLYEDDPVLIENNIFSSFGGNYAIYQGNGNTTSVGIKNNIFMNCVHNDESRVSNTPADQALFGYNLSNNSIATFPNEGLGPNLINEIDPIFVNFSVFYSDTTDAHLAPGSPAIDAGDPSSPGDIAGFGMGDLERADCGWYGSAYPFQGLNRLGVPWLELDPPVYIVMPQDDAQIQIQGTARTVQTID